MTPHLAVLQGALGVSLSQLAEMYRADVADESRDIDEVACRIKVAAQDTVFGDDLLQSLSELSTCFRHGCYIACMCLCGKLLEMALKIILDKSGIPYDEKEMIGALLGRIPRDSSAVYVDPAIKSQANIINQSRIPAVHAKTDIPVPSQHQAGMVINGTLDTIQRAFGAPDRKRRS